MSEDLMRVLTTEGVADLEIPHPDERSLAASHWNAVQHFLGTGRTDQLVNFYRARVAGFELETDPEVIEIREGDGELDIEHVYPNRR